MKLKKVLAALFVVLILFAGISPVMAEDPLEPSAIPGTIEGTGTDFAVTDSVYLNVTLQSSVAITVQLESVPSMVVMSLEAVEGATTTQMTLSGFVPSTTYYKYEDNYHNKEVITTDESGSYTWMQDVSAPRHVWIQPNPSTKFIKDDTTGGDCASIGTWDSGTKTCTLTMDVFETIQIDSDNVTLDGNGHMVQGSGSGNGVYLSSRTGVTVKNLFVQNFSHGIDLYKSNNNTLTGNTASNNFNGIYSHTSNNNTLTGNTASNNSAGIILNSNSSNNTLTGNTASSNDTTGIILNNNSSNNTLTGNTASNNNIHGIYLYKSNNNTLTGNTASNNNNGMHLYKSNNNTLTGNSIFENIFGINFSSALDSQIYNNLFIENYKQATVHNSTGIAFSLASPTGGNYWSNWTSPDSNNDGFVDSPYVFNGVQDDFPWAMPNGWLNPPVADAGENIQITTEGQPYTVVQGMATDPDGDDLQYRWLEGSEILLDWSAVGTEGEAPLDLATLPYLEIGNHTLILEVSDGTETATDGMVLAMENSPPVVQPAPSSQVIEIGVDPVIIIADVADFDGGTVTYECLKDGEVLDSGSVWTIMGGDTVQIPYVVVPAGDPRFPLGTHVIEIRVNDGINTSVSESVTITVIDSTAPSLSPLPNITMLWPPNHTMRPVTIQANAFDNGGGIINLDVTVASSELPDFDGDGSTIPDYYIDSVDDSTGIIELQLRSERSGKGEGRTYTVNITASDESGYQSEAHVEIKAPHDKRKK